MVEFDEDLLESTKIALHDEIVLNNTKRSTLRTIENYLNEISLVERPAPTADNINATELVLPDDPKLGAPITPERRLAIFEKLLDDINDVNNLIDG